VTNLTSSESPTGVAAEVPPPLFSADPGYHAALVVREVEVSRRGDLEVDRSTGRPLTDPSGWSHPDMKSSWEVISPSWLNPSRTTL